MLYSENSEAFSLYHRSADGVDTIDCGKSTTAACGTLDHVLSLHYNTNHTSQMGLKIITLKSLTIDEAITVSIF